MNRTLRLDAEILVVSDNAGDAALVKKLLEAEYHNVAVSTAADLHVAAFDKRPAEVLILAFHALEKAEHIYLALYRQSQKIHLKPHRTIILCNKDEVRAAYELCRRHLFDDYMLFWPLTHDSPRLLMCVHLALRELATMQDAGPTAAEFAAQARQLAALEAMLAQRLAQGDARILTTMRAVSQAEVQVGAALDGFKKRLHDEVQAEGTRANTMPALQREIDRIQRDEIGQPLQAAGDAVAPLGQWVEQLRTDLEPHLETARSLTAMADRVRPTLLIVDDDDMQRKLVATMLKGENYSLLFAISGMDALALLRKVRPDVILMDITMPGLDGLETTRRLKAVPGLLHVPVIMITGHSEGNVVIDSLSAGAAGFVVKPFDRLSLIGKITKALRKRPAAAVP